MSVAVARVEPVTDVELRHLGALAAIAEEGSFGRAAARLGYTQSTVSQQIAALERAVGGAVFDRPGGPKPVRLTPLGSVVLGHGRELLAKAEAIAHAVDRFRAGDGRIDIGTFQSVSNVILPSVVRRLRDEHPGCDIRLSEEEPEQPQIGDLDLLFYDGRIDGDVEHLKLLDDPYLLVAGAGTFPDGPVPLELLDGAPMVAWPLTCDQPAMEQALARGGARPQIVFRSAVNDTLLSMVRAAWDRRYCPGSPSAEPTYRPTTGSVSTSCGRPRRRARSTCTGGPDAPIRHSPPGPSRSPPKSRRSSHRRRPVLDTPPVMARSG
jgi:DNA-binding transcriptional LysR family regulator